MQLQKYSISNGYIKYDDKSSDMSAELTNLNHEGSGDFSSDLFTLTTKTKVDELSFIYGGIPYFANTQTGIDLDIKVDNKTNTYTFKTDKINLNDLKLSADGFFQMANDSVYRMDIKFNAPKTNFKNILS